MTDHSAAASPNPESVPHLEITAPWEKIKFEAPPKWTEPEQFDRTIPGKAGAHLTYLNWSRQVDIDTSTSFHSTAVRLESPLAVQHESQWKLGLDPRSQDIALHWLRVTRDGQSTDRLDRKQMRLIQRESQLEHLVIDGNWTLLVILDDVRPGDIIEAAFSVRSAHPIRPEGFEAYFAVPSLHLVGQYGFSIIYTPNRPELLWRASPDAPTRVVEETVDQRTRWVWRGAQLVPRDPENNQPSSIRDHTFIQVSDLHDWGAFAHRVASRWESQTPSSPESLFSAFPPPETCDERAIVGLIRRVQDQFRYLSVDLESSGWIPATPDAVAQRRYGDCKDLTWMAASLLRSWGIKARPVLVHSSLGERISDLLPMSLLFNHAVLEVSMGANTRWFDLTLRQQGGDFETTVVGWYGLGLIVDGASQELTAQPGTRHGGLVLSRERFLIDTCRDAPSLVELLVRVEGWQADQLRRNRLAQGAHRFTEERTETAQRRYGSLTRKGELQWREDRSANVCEIAETFEIRKTVYANESGDRALFDVPPSYVLQFIPVPPDKPRRTPWALPYPFELRHSVTVESASMGIGDTLRRRWSEQGFVATMEEPRSLGSWSKIVRLQITGPEVEAGRVSAFRRQMEEFLQASSWRIHLPWGRSRPISPPEFGQLPDSLSGHDKYIRAADPNEFPDAATIRVAPSGVPKRHGYGFGQSSRNWALLIPAILMLLFLIRSCSDQ